MVFLSVDVQDRHVDLPEVDDPPPDLDLSLDEFVALIKVFDELTVRFPDLVRAIEDPLLHAEKIQQLFFVIHHIDQLEVFANTQLKRLQHQKSKVHVFARDVPKGIDHPIHVEIWLCERASGPHIQHAFSNVKIHRRHHRDQISDLFRIQGGIAEAERTALANPEQIDRFTTVPLAHGFHTSLQVAVDVVVQRQPPIRSRRVSPVNEVDIHPQLQKISNQ